MNLSEAISRFRETRALSEAAPKQIAVTMFADKGYVQTAHNPRYKPGEPFVVGFRDKSGGWTDPNTFKTRAEAKKAHAALVRKLAKRHGGEARDTSDPNWVSKMTGTTPKRSFGQR